MLRVLITADGGIMMAVIINAQASADMSWEKLYLKVKYSDSRIISLLWGNILSREVGRRGRRKRRSLAFWVSSTRISMY